MDFSQSVQSLRANDEVPGRGKEFCLQTPLGLKTATSTPTGISSVTASLQISDLPETPAIAPANSLKSKYMSFTHPVGSVFLGEV